PRSDIYSLGCSLYVLLSGKKPFDGETVTDLLVRVLTTEARPLREVWPAAPRELQAIVERSMQRNKADRYPSARELAEDLTRYIEGREVQTRPAPITRRALRTASKHRGILLGAGIAVVALAGGLSVARFRRADPPPPAADRLAVWSPLFGELQSALDPESFRREDAEPLLERARREFPEQKGVVDALFDREHRRVGEALSALPRDRWLAERPRVARYQKWLQFARRPTEKADLILAYRGSCTIEIHIQPYAELRGPIAQGLAPEERQTPVTLKEFEIRDGDLELGHPEFGSARVKLAGLESGKTYTVEGSWATPGSIRLKEAP
ncbi:MAG TPA: hypothetical protein VEN81_10340, partial [Planctomycetota bacterium]|nr:hypothetical protein [Planctomycetota bacterium]